MNKILQIIALIGKPVIELINNLIDPEKKRERKKLRLEAEIEKMLKFKTWLETAIKKANKNEVKTRYETRLGICVAARARLRKELKSV
jgi:hypothetical protein